jgi:hypothetical protein
MKIKCLALALLLALGACSAKCPPAAQPRLAVDTPLRQFRLSGMTVDAALPPGAENASIAEDASLPGHQRGALLKAVAETIRSTFKQPGETGYAEAPAVSIRCVADELKAGGAVLYYHMPARFAATFTLADPDTGATLFEKRYAKEFDDSDLGTSAACLNKSLGRNYFQTALRDVLLRFAADTATLPKRQAKPRQAPINGTLTFTMGVISPTFANIEQGLLDARNHNVVGSQTMGRVAEVDIPNRLQAAIDKEKLFSGSSSAIYRVVSYVTKHYYRPDEMLADGRFWYEADTVIFKNDKEVGNVRFQSKSATPGTLAAEVERQVQGVVEFIKAKAAAWNEMEKSEEPNEKALIHAGRGPAADRLRHQAV